MPRKPELLNNQRILKLEMKRIVRNYEIYKKIKRTR